MFCGRGVGLKGSRGESCRGGMGCSRDESCGSRSCRCGTAEVTAAGVKGSRGESCGGGTTGVKAVCAGVGWGGAEERAVSVGGGGKQGWELWVLGSMGESCRWVGSRGESYRGLWYLRMWGSRDGSCRWV